MRQLVQLVAGLLAAGSLSAGLGAQISVQAVTKSTIRGYANAAFGQPGYYFMAANTDVSTGYARGASSSAAASSSSAGCSSTLTIATGSTPVVVEIYETSSGSGGGTGSSYGANTGVSEVVVTLRSKTLVAGRLDLSTGNRGQIDIGNDGSADLTGTDTAVADVVIGPHGLQFLFRADSKYSGYGIGSGTDQSRTTLRFTPSKGNMSVVGTPCRGPVLEGLFMPNNARRRGVLSLDVSQIPAAQMSFIAFGTQDPNVRIPPFGCPLRTDILIGVGVLPSQGAARLRTMIASSVRLPKAVTVRMQFLTVSNGGWVSSNSLALYLP